jgi:hypothetical protein
MEQRIFCHGTGNLIPRIRDFLLLWLPLGLEHLELVGPLQFGQAQF